MVLNNTSALPAKFQIMPQDETTTPGFAVMLPVLNIGHGVYLQHAHTCTKLAFPGETPSLLHS